MFIFCSNIKESFFSVTANPAPYCSVYPNALIGNPSNCAQFYDCRQQNTMFGNYLRECPYLQLYSESDKTCHSFERVICGLRPEPKAPCKCNTFVVIKKNF